jgi:hypothetical protein
LVVAFPPARQYDAAIRMLPVRDVSRGFRLIGAGLARTTGSTDRHAHFIQRDLVRRPVPCRFACRTSGAGFQLGHGGRDPTSMIRHSLPLANWEQAARLCLLETHPIPHERGRFCRLKPFRLTCPGDCLPVVQEMEIHIGTSMVCGLRLSVPGQQHNGITH